MPPLLALMLLAVPDPPSTSVVPAWLAYVGFFSLIVSLLSVGFAIYSAFRKESREEKQAREAANAAKFKRLEDHIEQVRQLPYVDRTTLDKRFEKLETMKDSHENRLVGFQQQHERFAEETNRRCTNIEREMGEVRQVREDVARMQAKMEFITEGQRIINEKLDRLLERR